MHKKYSIIIQPLFFSSIFLSTKKLGPPREGELGRKGQRAPLQGPSASQKIDWPIEPGTDKPLKMSAHSVIFKNFALTATMTVLRDISTAPMAGDNSTP